METSREFSSLVRPLSVGEVVDTGIRLVRGNFRLLAIVAAIVYVPLDLLQAFFSAIRPGSGTSSLGFPNWFGGILVGLALTFAFVRLIGAPSEAGVMVDLRPRALYAAAWTRFRPAMLLSILVLLGALLLVIPPLGVYVLVRWSVAGIAIVTENLNARVALGRSWSLTRGTWWHTFGVLVVFAAVAAILFVAVGALSVAISAAVSIATGSLLGGVFQFLLDVVVSVVFVPLEAAILVVLYYDLRARHEGLDLELRFR